MLLKLFLKTMKKPNTVVPDLTADSLAALQAHDWPGNVRELRNVLERALALGTAPGHLIAPLRPGSVVGGDRGATQVTFSDGLSFRDQKEKWNDEFENRYLRWLVGRAEGNVSKAARMADMDRKYLHKLLRKHDIDPADLN
jgi:DNA-binding NtrC family response regulator